MRNCMKVIATRPEMVVRLDPAISGMDLLNAAMQASRAAWCSRSSVKRWHRMIA